MRRPRRKLEVNTFPFLAVLLCAMGSFIVVLLIMDRRAKIAAQNKANDAYLAQKLLSEERREKARADALEQAKKTQDELNATAKALWIVRREKIRSDLQAEEDALAAQIAQAMAALGKLDELDRDRKTSAMTLKQKIDLEDTALKMLQKELAARQTQLDNVRQTSSQHQKVREQWTRELVVLEAALKSVQDRRATERPVYSLVPYKGKHGADAKPIYIEVTDGAVAIHPGPTPLAGVTLTAQALRQAIEDRTGPLEKVVLRPGLPPAKRTKDPYVLFLVRPAGIPTYYDAMNALRDYHVDYGYELIEPDWVFDFGDGRIDTQPWRNVARIDVEPSNVTRPAPKGLTPRPPLGPGGDPGFPPGPASFPGVPTGPGMATRPPGSPGSGNVPGPVATLGPGGAATIPAGPPGVGTFPGVPGGVPGGTNVANKIGGPPGIPGIPNSGFGTFPGVSGSPGDPNAANKMGSPPGIPGVPNSGVGVFPGAPGGSPGDPSVANKIGGPPGAPGAPNFGTVGPIPGPGIGTFPANPVGVPGGTNIANNNGGPPAGSNVPPGAQTGSPGAVASGTSGAGSTGGNPSNTGGNGGSPVPGTVAGNPGVPPSAPGTVNGVGPPPGANVGAVLGPPSSVGTGNPAGPTFAGNGGSTGSPGPAQGSPGGPRGDPSAPPGAQNTASSSGAPGAPSGQPGGVPNVSIDLTPKPPNELPLTFRTIPTGTLANDGSADDGGEPGPAIGQSPFLRGDKGRPGPRLPSLSRITANRDFILTIECYDHSVSLTPPGRTFDLSEPDALDQLHRMTKLLVDRRQATVRPGEPPYRPIIHFRVQPDGRRTYYSVYPRIAEFGFPMSRDAVD